MLQERKQLPCLTGARFVAALLVLFFHFGRLKPVPGIVFEYGQQAVSFFFILSGVVLAYTYHEPILRKVVGWAGFVNARLARIVPLHVATWLIATVLSLFLGWRTYQGDHPLTSWLMGLFCLQAYVPTSSNLFRWNGQSWSISCELFFYALFPLLLIFLARRLNSIKSIAASAIGVFVGQTVLYFCVSGILAKALYLRHPLVNERNAERLRDITLVFPPLRLGEFVIGICLGLLIVRRGCALKSARNANLLLGFCAASVIALKALPWGRFGPLMTGAEQYLPYVPFLALMILAVSSGLTVLTPVLENRIAVLLGEASYSLYLVHGFLVPGSYLNILRGAVPVNGRAARPAEYVLCVIGCIVGSIVSYLLLERPARKAWRQALIGRGTSRPGTFENTVSPPQGSEREPIPRTVS
jgi:peptidoglycan/LPS O-acetylase OafA/YrhL